MDHGVIIQKNRNVDGKHKYMGYFENHRFHKEAAMCAGNAHRPPRTMPPGRNTSCLS